MVTEVWIRASGTPIPQGSKVAGKASSGRPFVRDANPRALKDWREAIAQAAWRAMQEGAFQIDALTEPVEVCVWLYFEKPASSKAAEPVSARVGDLDKHLRAICDGLVDGGCLDDDKYVIRISGSKQWADENTRPGAMIHVLTTEGA